MYSKTQPPVFTPKGSGHVLSNFLLSACILAQYKTFHVGTQYVCKKYFSNLNAKIFLGIPLSLRARVRSLVFKQFFKHIHTTKYELNIKYVQRKWKPQRYLAGREKDLDINDKYLIVIGAVLGFDERLNNTHHQLRE